MSNGDNGNHRENRRQAYVAPEGFSALPSGTRLSNRYVIESVIGAGGFGITYLARHEALGKPYAIKEHFPRQYAYRDGASATVRPSDPPTFRWTLERFLQEGRSLARCKHPAIVGVSDVFEAYGTAYMVLEFEDGVSLARWLEGIGRPPTQEEMDLILGPLLDALAYLHSHDMLHRDIAPDNIMIRNDGRPCLIDFGAARQAIAERSQVMSAIVKAGYSPPEQYTTAGRSQGPWTDIYALAGTAYRAIAGVRPSEATERQIEDDLVPIAQRVAPGSVYRPQMLAAIDAGLRLRPGYRPQNVAEWHQMLGLPGPAPVYHAGGRSEPPSRPRDAASASERSGPASVPRVSGARTPSGTPIPAPATPQPASDGLPGYPEMTRRTAAKDASRSRLVVAGVLGAVIMVFGSNLAGFWETPSQREARERGAPRSPPIKTKPSEAPKRVVTPQTPPAVKQDTPPPRGTTTTTKPDIKSTDCVTTKPPAVTIPACSSLIAKHDDFAEAYYVRGLALRERGQLERAVTDFSKAIEHAPRNAASFSQRALTYSRLGEHRRALADYDKAVEIAPQNAAHYNDRALVHMNLSDFDRAFADLEKAIEINPRYSLPYNNRGRAYVRGRSDHPRAIADYTKAIEIDPRYAVAFENRGLSYLETKELDLALADFNKVIELTPNSARAYNGRGVAHERKGSRDLAIADYRKAASLDQAFKAPADNLKRLGVTP